MSIGSGMADSRGRAGGDVPAREPQACAASHHQPQPLLLRLERQFRRTRAWIGERPFRIACELHFEQPGDSMKSIEEQVSAFPAALAFFFGADPEVGELAWLDWALGVAAMEESEALLSKQDLRRVDWDGAMLGLSRSVRTAEARTNAGAIWLALARGAEPPPVRSLAGSGHLGWQGKGSCRFRTVPPLEHRALRLVTQNASFASVCAMLIDATGREKGIAMAGELLARWVHEGVVTAIVDGASGVAAATGGATAQDIAA